MDKIPEIYTFKYDDKNKKKSGQKTNQMNKKNQMNPVRKKPQFIWKLTFT